MKDNIFSINWKFRERTYEKKGEKNSRRKKKVECTLLNLEFIVHSIQFKVQRVKCITFDVCRVKCTVYCIAFELPGVERAVYCIYCVSSKSVRIYCTTYCKLGKVNLVAPESSLLTTIL